MKIQHKQKIWLAIIAVIGLIGPNGVFLYFAFWRWTEFAQALRHPVTLAFVIESFIVMGLLAAYLARKSERWGWKSFVVLSLIGGLGFGIPAIVLLNAQFSHCGSPKPRTIS